MKSIFFFSLLWSAPLFATNEAPLPQTDVDHAEHRFDVHGVPILNIKGLGEQRQPAGVAVYALAYAGRATYDARLSNLTNHHKFQACIDWLTNHLKQKKNGLWLWDYPFDSTYNDIHIKAPWSSAFAQATGVQALLAAYQQRHDPALLDLANKAAKSLMTPIAQGGFLFKKNEDVWFEEIPIPQNNPTHILNGHMRTLLALKELADVTHSPEVQAYFKAGADTLYRWLPRYDTGYWLRYDLNPKKSDLLFRLANPYGFKNYPLTIHKITLRDPITKTEINLPVGEKGDHEGLARIAGLHWGQPETRHQRKARQLLALENKTDEPHSYFYLALPNPWTDNLREDGYELVMDYYDDARANVTVQQRSIAPGQTFIDMRDGDLLLTGADHWRQWIIPLRPTDLGYWVGKSYADKHAQYLKQLATYDSRFKPWENLAYGYLNTRTSTQYKKINPGAYKLPKQRPILPLCNLDQDGVFVQYQANNKSRFLPDGSFDIASEKGPQRYSPFLIADQLMNGPQAQCASSYQGARAISKQSALKWLLNTHHQKRVNNAILYEFNFQNIYNDVITKAPWASSFSQAYVLKALEYALVHQLGSKKTIEQLMQHVANSFLVDGGVSSTTKEGLIFFEEVPNATHVLNAHLISTNELAATSRHNEHIGALSWQGLLTLKEKLHLFDTGYWLRYDLNPKKELLFQMDWLSGEQSPLIETIELRNPMHATKTVLDAGSPKAFESAMHLSGTDWQPEQVMDGKPVRGFQNGYKIRQKAIPGGTRHNVYFQTILPTRLFSDDFDVPPHQLVIHYKDMAPGAFDIKIQAVNEGHHSSFTPLRNGVIHTIGDKQWKTAYLQVRPQDLGWYVGPDYQQYEVSQIQRIANLTNDWFFYQYAQKQRAYLEAKDNINHNIPSKEPVRVIIKNSSPTYPGFGFENALNGTPDKGYVAGLEGEKMAFVDLEFKKPVSLSALVLQWENIHNFAKKVLLTTSNEHDSIQVNIKQGGTSHIRLSHPQHVKTLRLTFSAFSGQPRLLLRQIQLKTNTQSPLDEPYLSAHDSKNPLHVFRLPVTMQIKKLSDELSAGAQNEHEKILRYMDYIAQFRVGVARDATPEAAIEEQVGACGTFTNTLLALAAAQGMQGRIVSLLNSPNNDGHALAEVFVDGEWRLYDPTFNAFYNAKEQLPLSFDEIRRQCKANPQSVHLHAKTIRPGIASYTGCPLFLNANPAGVIGPDHPMVFPLQLSDGHHNTIEKKEFGAKHQGASFIGAAATNQQQRWRLNHLSVGKTYEFIIQPNSLGGDISNNDLHFSMKASIHFGTLVSDSTHVFDFSKANPNPWAIQFVAQQPEVILTISHPFLGPQYRYVNIQSYELRKMTLSKT